MTVQHAPCLVFNDVACDGNGVNQCNHLVREKANIGARRRQGGEGRARVKVGHGKLGLVSSVQDQLPRKTRSPLICTLMTGDKEGVRGAM